jgi:hypothetical protein
MLPKASRLVLRSRIGLRDDGWRLHLIAWTTETGVPAIGEGGIVAL